MVEDSQSGVQLNVLTVAEELRDLAEALAETGVELAHVGWSVG